MPIRRFMSKAYRTCVQAKDDAFNRKNLFYTNVLLSTLMSMTGDTLEQQYEFATGEIDKIDVERTLQMGFSGSVSGVICHNWYNILDKVIVGRSLEMVVKKLLLDQCICSPIVIMSFFATVAIFEENPLDSFTDEVKEKFWILYRAEWVVWPPAQIINFYFVPTRFRVLYDNTISLGYDIYTSQVKHGKSHNKDKKNDQAHEKSESEVD